MSGNELDAEDDRHNPTRTTTSDDRDGRGYASSDDDIEIKHESVSNYWLVSGDETPVSFSVLPYSFEDDEKVVPGMEIYLRGTSDNGMCLYVRALSWKLELSGEKPTFHLRTEKYWIKLLKPRKSYEETIRSILSVSHFLNYALVNLEDSEKAAWDHVKDLFPSWEVEPSRKDLPLHLPIIEHLISSNGRLASSMALQTIDIGLSRKASIFAGTEDGQQSNRKRMYVSDGEDIEAELHHKDKRSKVELGLGSDEEMNGFGEDADDEVGDLFETVCCICDNGGEVTGCDGPCMRSFHVHKNAQGADDVNCSTLGFSKSKLERMDKFYCPNCEAKEHQCYACGELGCSDETAGAMQEVFVCDAAMCGHFYHPTCAAELILRDNDKIKQTALAQMIKEGKGFVCPMHKCWKCGKGEVKEERDLQFGICRRCPRVWHRKCFPASILFDEEIEDEPRGEDQITRAWDGLLLNRILIYCKRHPIISKLGTPARSQVKFPTSYMSTVRRTSENNKLEQMEKEAKWNKVDSLKKRNKNGSNQIVEKKVVMASEADALHKKTATVSSGPISVKKKLDGATSSGRPPVFVLRKLDSSIKHDGKTMESCENVEQSNEKCDPDGLSRQEKVSGTGVKLKPAVNTSLQQPQEKSKSCFGKSSIISNETRRMVDSIIQRAKARVTLESVLKKHEVPMNYRGANPKNAYRKHSLVRIESIIKGMQKAVETLENGGSIEEAKMKCSPHLVKYLEICRNDLRVYLSPFLYGARYTSYGRHFTKTDKLERIADRLHWYMDEGDMVVDFCCGANEFSLLMKEKLDEFGKQCNYKNFDAIQTNNDFHFTKRDWFKVKQEDLPDGSRLIMGLNPPFGVKAALANQFIDHALKFKPKLVVLIVPKETERLDRKREKYDLIWEDPDLLEGKSFYLPGSVDVDENPLNDWNSVAPPLYLWSRSDWTSRHKQIALEKGHISTETSTQFLGTPWIPQQEPRDTLLVPAFNSDIDKKNNSTIIRRKAAECVSNEREALPTEPMVVGALASSNGNNLPKLAGRHRTNKHSPSKLSIGIANDKNVIPNSSNDIHNDRHLPLNTSDGIAVDSRLLPNISNDIVKDNIRKPTPTIGNKSPSWDGAEKLFMSERPFRKGSMTVQGVARGNDLSKVEKKRESPKEKATEGKDRHCKREMADKGRQSLELKPDTSWKGKTNDRYDSDGQRSKSSEKHRLINESESGGRKSSGAKWSSVHDTLDRYGSSWKWSPIRSDRRSIEFDAHRKISPERHRHSTSSVVDLDIYSSKGVNKDQDRNYGKTGALRYQDYRQASPGRRYQEAHSTNYLDHNARRQDAYNLDGQRRVYEDPSCDSIVKNDALNLIERYGNEYGQATSGQFDKLSYGRRGRANADNYQAVGDGGMLAYGSQADQYRTYDLASIQTETNPFPSTVGRAALPRQNHVIPRYSSASPSLNYVPYQLQQQDHVVDPALLSSHRLFDNRLERAQQASLPQYPPVQGRFGGWIED